MMSCEQRLISKEHIAMHTLIALNSGILAIKVDWNLTPRVHNNFLLLAMPAVYINKQILISTNIQILIIPFVVSIKLFGCEQK